jgi:tripartite ATP-independent transporter DctM subunit
LRALDIAAQGLVAAALISELTVVLANVVARTFFSTSFLWTDEVARLALSTLAFIGGALAYRYRHHSFISIVLNRIPERARAVLSAVADVLVFVVALVAGITSFALIASDWSEVTPVLHIPAGVITLPLTVGAGLIALFALERLFIEYGIKATAIGALCGLAAVVIAISQHAWVPSLSSNVAVVLTLCLFLATLIGGLPVAFALLFASGAYLWITNTAPMVEIPHNMIAGTSNYVLLALPFFIVAGLIMERGEISVRLVRFIHTLVGHFRGGLLQVMVVSMYLVSGLSGSKAADVAAVGTVMRDMLKREGYTTGECAAALAASAAMGETVPPSISILILGSITSLSMAALFLGGVIPAAVIAVCLMLMIYVRARYAGTPSSSRADLRSIVVAGAKAVLPLLMPVILFGGILSGITTPTEVSAFAIVYGLVLAVVIYRALDLRAFARILRDSATLSGMILFILAAAQCFSWVLTNAYVPQRLVELLHALHDSPALFMLGSIVLLIVAGSLLEGLPAINVLAPLLVPIAASIGVSPLHFGIVLVIAMGIGAFLPPTGVGFYVCCAISRASIEEGSRAMVPYLAILIVGLLIVAFVPWFTLFLPKLAGFRT